MHAGDLTETTLSTTSGTAFACQRYSVKSRCKNKPVVFVFTAVRAGKLPEQPVPQLPALLLRDPDDVRHGALV